MLSNSATRLTLMVAVAGALVATPALAEAQGNSKKGNDRAKASDSRQSNQRPELIRRGDVWEVQQRRDDRRGNVQNGPAFCRSGAGHPVHGKRWCEDRGYRMDNVRYDSRTTDRNRRNATSYESAHLEFHRRHDRECQARAAERPLDVQHQIRVRNECRQRHEEWHRRQGRAH